MLKDTGRVLQMSYGHVDRLAKLVPNHPTDPWTLERALNGVSELAAEYKSDAQVRRLFDLALKLEGLPRHSSTHAAGVVIGDRPLAELVPLYRDPRSDMPVTQFDMKYSESAGLVKFDFLGLKTLSVLQKACDLIEAREGVRPDLDALEWDDEDVYALLQRGDTVGVFSWNRRHAPGRWRLCGPPTSGISSRSCRSTGRARWTISACSGTGRTAASRSNIRTRCSRASCRKPTASSSIRSR
ncbi:MAG: hypothetical protein IPO97_11100 [Sphingomonadales bacterium]|nr:hypothetical protein [Sphingomonadales bacterium]